MIKRFRHKGLERFHLEDDARGINAKFASRIDRILTNLDVAKTPAAMNMPGYRLHPLKGELAGLWAVSVSGNWRIVFAFEGDDATDVDFLDYH